jgi:hypothetical protein
MICKYEHSWVKAITCDKYARRRCTYCGLIEVSKLEWVKDTIDLQMPTMDT